MNQIFNEIDDDLKQDRILNFIKKYKFVFVFAIKLHHSDDQCFLKAKCKGIPSISLFSCYN